MRYRHICHVNKLGRNCLCRVKEEADAAFRAKLEAEKAECEKKTAARAAKRLKKKAALKAKRKAGKAAGGDSEDSGSESEGSHRVEGTDDAASGGDVPAVEKRARVDVDKDGSHVDATEHVEPGKGNTAPDS